MPEIYGNGRARMTKAEIASALSKVRAKFKSLKWLIEPPEAQFDRQRAEFVREMLGKRGA